MDISLSVSSFYFIVFIIAAIAAYYICPKRGRWAVLLVFSIGYYLLSDLRCFLFLLITSISVYLAALEEETVVQSRKEAIAQAETKEEKKLIRAAHKRRQRLIVAAAAVLNLALLAGMKYSGIFSQATGFVFTGFLAAESGRQLLMPLGISFYTFQALGYLIDVYNGKIAAEKSYFKFLLFVSFFPQIVQGPISSFDQLAPQLYEGNDFDYDRFKAGLELILWGYLKKLVVADRIYPIIGRVTGSWERYPGLMLFMTMLLYSAQLYADFSGGIDISRGICEIIGIELTPNFRQPFFSKSLLEFWRRWHITLGGWFRNYVFYPLATSKAYNKLGGLLRKKMSRTASDRICSSLVSLITFLLIGIWHGAAACYILYGLWHGGLIGIGTVLTDVFDRIKKFLHIKPEFFPWRLFQMIRTYLLVLFGFYMVMAPSVGDAVSMALKLFTDPLPPFQKIVNFFLQLQFYRDLPVVLIGIALMLAVSILQAAFGRDIRKDLNRLPLVVQWPILLAGVLLVMVFGCYGPGYDATSFIYQIF